MGYTKNVISGFSWHTLLKITTMAAALVKISILARLLSPNDFGLFSLIMIAFGIVEAVTQTGVNITIINSKRKVEYFLNSAWVIAIIRGLLMGIVMLVLGILMGRYYNEPQLAFLVAVTALAPVIKGFINPYIVVMRKELQFFKDSFYRFGLVMVDMVLAIIFGLMLQSVMAMVLALIGAAIFEVIISFIFFPERPSFQYIHSRGKVILSNAKGLSVSAALSYAHENIDDFILGKLVGTYNLGLYHNAYSLSHKTNYELSKAVQHTTLPVYVKIKESGSRLKRAFIKSVVGGLGFVTLTSLPLLLFPGEIVEIVLGDQWLTVIPLIPWLVGAGIMQSLTDATYNLFYATERFFVINIHLFATIVLLVSLLLILTDGYGLEGAAMAIMYSRLITLPFMLIATVRLLQSAAKSS